MSEPQLKQTLYLKRNCKSKKSQNDSRINSQEARRRAGEILFGKATCASIAHRPSSLVLTVQPLMAMATQINVTLDDLHGRCTVVPSFNFSKMIVTALCAPRSRRFSPSGDRFTHGSHDLPEPALREKERFLDTDCMKKMNFKHKEDKFSPTEK